MTTFDVLAETPISLSKAADFLPRREDGRKFSVRTIERWIRHGHRGVLLEGAYFGKTLTTSVQALRRFSARLSGQQPASQTPSPAAARFLTEQGFAVPGYSGAAVA
jgi:hypothetical protein